MRSIQRMARKLGGLLGGARFQADGEMERELATHVALLEEELMRRGETAAEARRLARVRLGGLEQTRMLHREERGLPLLESLITDVRFGWRQLMKRKVTTAAAVLSLGLGMGASLAAFRLVDALFLRPLPVSHPERLYGVFRQGQAFLDGRPDTETSFEYPVFAQMRDAVKDRATVVGVASRQLDVADDSAGQPEKAQAMYVSGALFGAFGLHAELGRLLTESDDVTPGAHPYAVISYDYWLRRFGGDPKVVGHVLRLEDGVYQIVGVGPQGFTGTEPGTAVDIFLPAMMHTEAKNARASWIGAYAVLNPGTAAGPVGERLNAVYEANVRERVKSFSGRPQQFLVRYLSWHARVEPAPSGISRMQEDYRPALTALCVLVTMVLLIACANVANLMSAQATARSKEMALRASLGAGRSRLVRLVLVESAMVGVMAAALAVGFASWAAPRVAERIGTPGHPVRLVLGMDGSAALFAAALALVVTLLFGLAPALRAGRVQPVSALKGDKEPLAKARWMQGLIGSQVAFCFVVLFFAGLFAATFQKMTRQPLGFAPERVSLLQGRAVRPMTPQMWQVAAEHLRSLPGVESVGISAWPLLSGNSSGAFISVNGVANGRLASLLQISPGWIETMRMPLISGRDFREEDEAPGNAIASRSFAKMYLGVENAVGQSFVMGGLGELTVVGVTEDARYQSIREDAVPVLYLPLQVKDAKTGLELMRQASFTLRTHDDAAVEAARQEIHRVQPDLHVTMVQTQSDLVRAQTVRERLLAALAGFFGGVALLLAALGLYGVLHYSVMQRQREIGIRIALGAAAANIVRIVTVRVMGMVSLGAVVGLVAGLGSVRFVSSLLYGVKGTDLSMMAMPGIVLLSAAALAALAALPVVLRAVRIDPVVMLRSE